MSARGSDRRLDEQPELGRARRRLGAGAAAELGQDVAHVHVDGARAEDELARRSRGSCGRRRPGAHLELAAREAGALVRRRRRGGPRWSLDRRAEARRPRAAASAASGAGARGVRAVRWASPGARAPRSRSPAAASATPARSRICARSNGMSRPPCSSSARAELLGGRVRRRRRRARSRRARGRARRARRDGRLSAAIARQRLGAGARVGRVAVAGEASRRPAQAPDRVVVVLAALPAREHGAAVLARAASRSPSASASQASGPPRCRHCMETTSRRVAVVEAAQEQRPRRARRCAAAGVDRAEEAVGDQGSSGPASAAISSRHELADARPSRRARAARRPCSSGTPCSRPSAPRSSQSPRAVSSASRAPP